MKRSAVLALSLVAASPAVAQEATPRAPSSQIINGIAQCAAERLVEQSQDLNRSMTSNGQGGFLITSGHYVTEIQPRAGGNISTTVRFQVASEQLSQPTVVDIQPRLDAADQAVRACVQNTGAQLAPARG